MRVALFKKTRWKIPGREFPIKFKGGSAQSGTKAQASGLRLFFCPVSSRSLKSGSVPHVAPVPVALRRVASRLPRSHPLQGRFSAIRFDAEVFARFCALSGGSYALMHRLMPVVWAFSLACESNGAFCGAQGDFRGFAQRGKDSGAKPLTVSLALSDKAKDKVKAKAKDKG